MLAGQDRDRDRVLQVGLDRAGGLRGGVRGLVRLPDAPAAVPPPRPRPGRAGRTRAGRPQAAGHGRDDLLRRARGQLPAPGEDQHLRRAFRLVEIAGGEHHRGALGGSPGDQRPQVGPADRVHPGGRLVEDQQGRLVQHRGDDTQLLAHPAGQAPGQPVPRVQQPGPLQVITDPRAGPAPPGSGRRPPGRPGSRPRSGPGTCPSRRPGTRSGSAAGARPSPHWPRRLRSGSAAAWSGPPVPAHDRAHLAGPGPERHVVQGQPVTVADAHAAGAPAVAGPGRAGRRGSRRRTAGRRGGVHRDSPTAAAAGPGPAAPGAAAGPLRPPLAGLR